MFGLAAKWNRYRRNRLERLAETLDRLAERDDASIAKDLRLEETRRAAAVELHSICRAFTAGVNELLKRSGMVLDPGEFQAHQYVDSENNMFQINIRGRIVVLRFGPSQQADSTENFREPYILEGEANCFNQDLLENNSVEERGLFYCTGPGVRGWRYFDPRSYQTGPFDETCLVSLFERLI